MCKFRIFLLTTALATGIPPFAAAQTIGGFTSPGGVLDTVTVNGTTYDASSLINGTVSTAPGGLTDPDRVQLLVGSGNPAPAPGSRASLINSPQLRLDTALLNITGLTFVFDAPVANGPGIDLLIWDWGGFGGNPGDVFDLTLNGQTATGLTEDDASLPSGGVHYRLTASVSSVYFGSDDNSGISSVAQLEAASLTFSGGSTGSQTFTKGLIGIDLDAFGVASGSTINELTISNGVRIDPSLILGLPPGSDLTPFRITSITSVGGTTWELTLQGEPLTDYEFRSSTTLDFNPGTLLENLSQGDPVNDPGITNNSVLTTDSNGDGTVRVILNGDPADFVRAQTTGGS